MKLPEMPLMVFPSQARRYGVEAALLLSILQGKVQSSGQRQLTASRQVWLNRCQFWSRDQFEALIQKLVEAEVLNAIYHSEGLTIGFKDNELDVDVNRESKQDSRVSAPIIVETIARTVQSTMPSAPSAGQEVDHRSNSGEFMQKLPVYNAPPVVPLPTVTGANTLKGRGPAPSFGGSTGWKKRSNDELQQVFAQQEELNKQLFAMTMNWQPSSMFYNTLGRNNIPKEFAERCLDEFVLYYSDGKKKERSWDQKFLAWVKRDWVKQQGRSNNSTNNSSNEKQPSGYQNENSQRDTREKRKRITAAIMDINDTTW